MEDNHNSVPTNRIASSLIKNGRITQFIPDTFFIKSTLQHRHHAEVPLIKLGKIEFILILKK